MAYVMPVSLLVQITIIVARWPPLLVKL